MFLRMLFGALFALHSLSFSMIVSYKDKETRKKVKNSVCGYIAKQETIQEKKKWKSLPQEEQDQYKLARLYEKQDNPRFVARYLEHQDVQIFLISMPYNKEKFGINPYVRSFYKNPDKQIFMTNQYIVDLGRFKENVQKIHHPSYKDATNSLFSGIFFGNNEDVIHEFVKMDEQLQGNNVSQHDEYFGIISFALQFPLIKNNALELLLQREKSLSAPLMDEQERCRAGYCLLHTAAQNKKYFELVAHKDPYNSNRMLYSTIFGEVTHLDCMKINDRNAFDQEHIDIFVREGGMSAKEVEGINQVDRILQGQITDEELFMKDFWSRLLDKSNSNNRNKYLESQRVLRGAQRQAREEEAARRMAEREMGIMMARLMNAISGNDGI